MNTQSWFNTERVSQPGSVILTEWRAQRQAARMQNSTPVSEILPGTEMYEMLTGMSTSGAGVPVTDQTAVAHAAVYACTSLIGGAVASMPFHIFKRDGESRSRYDTDLWYLFNEQPWPNWTAASAWNWVTRSIGLHGDGFWRIRRVSPYSNAIEGFEPWHPNRTTVRREKGRNIYTHVDEEGVMVTLDQDDVLHFPGDGFDGVRSQTPLRSYLRNAVGIALAADTFAGAFFRNGARPDFALKTKGGLNKDQRDNLLASWAARHSGPGNAHLPAVLTGGLEVERLSLNAEDSQLLATRRFQVEEIARAYGVPPHMIGHTEKATSWGTGVEQMSIGFVRYTLTRYLDTMRQEVNRKVWPKSRLFFAEHNKDALLEGDSKAQGEYLSKAVGGPGQQGWMKVNEVRRLKNLPPVPGGDQLVWAGAAATPSAGRKPDEEEPQTGEKPEGNHESTDQTAGE